MLARAGGESSVEILGELVTGESLGELVLQLEFHKVPLDKMGFLLP